MQPKIKEKRKFKLKGRQRGWAEKFKLIIPVFGRFLVVGLSGTVVNLGVLHFLVLLGLVKVTAVLVATEVSIINNFFWNDRWTFQRQNNSCLGLNAGSQNFSNVKRAGLLARWWRFQLVAALSAVFTVGMFFLFNHFLELHYLLAQLLAIGLATTLNFVTNLWFTWNWWSFPLGLTGVKEKI